MKTVNIAIMENHGFLYSYKSVIQRSLLNFDYVKIWKIIFLFYLTYVQNIISLSKEIDLRIFLQKIFCRNFSGEKLFLWKTWWWTFSSMKIHLYCIFFFKQIIISQKNTGSEISMIKRIYIKINKFLTWNIIIFIM